MRSRRWWPGAVCVASAVFAVTLGATDVVKVSPARPSPLADAVQRGDRQAVQELLNKKADVNVAQAEASSVLPRADASSAENQAIGRRLCGGQP